MKTTPININPRPTMAQAMRFLSSPGIERAISKHEAEKIRLNEKSQRIQHGNHNTKKGPGRVHCNGPIGGPVKDED